MENGGVFRAGRFIGCRRTSASRDEQPISRPDYLAAHARAYMDRALAPVDDDGDATLDLLTKTARASTAIAHIRKVAELTRAADGGFWSEAGRWRVSVFRGSGKAAQAGAGEVALNARGARTTRRYGTT